MQTNHLFVELSIKCQLICYLFSSFLRERLYSEEDYTVGFLCPNYNGFLTLMDECFVDALSAKGGKDTSGAHEDTASGEQVMMVFDASQQDPVLAKVEESKLEVVAQSITDLDSVPGALKVMAEQENADELEICEADEEKYKGKELQPTCQFCIYYCDAYNYYLAPTLHTECKSV